MLTDEAAERMGREAEAANRTTLLRWVQDLLEDRQQRSALLQGQTRRLVYTRKRLRQAASYLEGLLLRAEGEAAAAWPGKIACPHCGAPATLVRAEQRDHGHALVHDHPDGVRCEATPGDTTGGRKRQV